VERITAAVLAEASAHVHTYRLDQAGRVRIRRTGRGWWAFRVPLVGGGYRTGTARIGDDGDAVASIGGTVYGPKYDETADEQPKHIAARIRDELRGEAKQAGSVLHRFTSGDDKSDPSLSAVECHNEREPQRKARYWVALTARAS
jgi:hypothetical protein